MGSVRQDRLDHLLNRPVHQAEGLTPELIESRVERCYRSGGGSDPKTDRWRLANLNAAFRVVQVGESWPLHCLGIPSHKECHNGQ